MHTYIDQRGSLQQLFVYQSLIAKSRPVQFQQYVYVRQGRVPVLAVRAQNRDLKLQVRLLNASNTCAAALDASAAA
jgi:hypothetical protein